MGYNKPIMTQYYLYWRHILTAGDFGVGEQMYVGQEVTTIMLTKIPYSIVVNLYSILIRYRAGGCRCA